VPDKGANDPIHDQRLYLAPLFTQSWDLLAQTDAERVVSAAELERLFRYYTAIARANWLISRVQKFQFRVTILREIRATLREVQPNRRRSNGPVCVAAGIRPKTCEDLTLPCVTRLTDEQARELATLDETVSGAPNHGRRSRLCRSVRGWCWIGVVRPVGLSLGRWRADSLCRCRPGWSD
jgi:hypothetical protein